MRLVVVAMALWVGLVAKGNPLSTRALPYLGTWDAVEKNLPGSWGLGYERQGVLEQAWGPGQHSHTIVYRLADGKLAGHELLTWNPATDSYQGHALSDQGPGAVVTEGKWQNGQLVFRGEIRQPGQQLRVLKVLSPVIGGAYTIRVSMSVNDGPYTLYVENRLKRRPTISE